MYAGSASMVSRARLSWADCATARTSASSACTRYAAWKAPWCAIPSVAETIGFSEGALAMLTTTCSANPTRSISAPCTWGSVRRPNGSWIRAGVVGSISSRIVRETHCAPGKGVATSTAGLNASGLPCTAAKPIAATTTALRARWSRSETASAASARTAALLDMNVSASPGPNSTVRSTGGSLVRSPHSTSAVVESAARSAVPTLPPSRTGGRASLLIIAASASTTSGSMPLPSASSWLRRTASIARTRSAERRSPELVACDRSSRSAWESGSGRTRSRLAPTPVERP